MDPRVEKLAQVLVNYSMDIQPGEVLGINTNCLASELVRAVYKEAVLAGGHVVVSADILGLNEILLKHGSDAQLDFVSPIPLLAAKEFDAILSIMAFDNTRSLSNVDPARQSRARRSMAEFGKIMMERRAAGELKVCITLYPTYASAQEADMSLTEYEDFVYGAGLLDQADPVALWKEEGERQRRLIDWLAGKDQVMIKGSNVDLEMSISGRTFLGASGKINFPDGEIFTSPVEDSVNGWIRFSYPAIYGGREVEDIELWFENGRVVKEKAAKGQDILTALLGTDEGSRTLGELGIGTNYGIQRFVKNMLFDEKLGGTIHLALGRGFPEAGSQNQSSLHWDMLCDMAQSEIVVDGKVFYKDGKVVI
ncbi:MAG: aminopeptidase [Anaerolineae bacterium]|nr:aminopeptidase [Anaerolineae bacterium]